MTTYKKLKLLVWKNYVLQKRHKWQTIFEIASPVVFSLFLILIRSLVMPKEIPGLHYDAFSATNVNLVGLASGDLKDFNFTTLKKEGNVAFSPEGKLTREVTKEALHTVVTDNLNGILAFLFDPTLLPEPVGYKNAIEMEDALNMPGMMKKILVGISFGDDMANATSWPDHITISIRFPAVMRVPIMEHPIYASWRTNLLFPLFPKAGSREPTDMYGGNKPGYYHEIFLAVQHALSLEVIKAKTGRPVETKVYLQRYPQLPHREDTLLIAMERFISMIVMVCFAYTFVNTVRAITSEKELQLKEAMTIMGIPYWMHWLAWFIKQFTFLCISVVCIVFLFKIPFRPVGTSRFAVLTFTPWTILLFFMLLFIMVSISFCFLISVFFSKANTAASFMGLAWFASYSLFMLTQVLYEDISLSTKLALCLISNTAMGFAFQMMVMGEGTGLGLQWDQFFSPMSYHDNFLPWHVVMMLLVDTVLYTLIAMYVERTFPGKFGVPLPLTFPFTKRFWFPKRHKAELSSSNSKEYQNALLKVVHDDEPTGTTMGVDIQNLTKKYGHKLAVDNLNIRMYDNEITVLLGHNGAGKTTTISMLTGTIPPTSGRAMIGGYNIFTETEQARKYIGVCPQHNVLFPDLTVGEHIVFYTKLKGVDDSKVKEEVNNYLKLLNLEHKRNVVSANLSGGQQRRLSVGTAMCGGSRVVLLDEPTSGLDPAARRALWDLLNSEKKGRTIILTTHFMDEAEVLGDRIAIMSGGHLQCYGTSYYLKKHYGIGYKITIIKGENCNIDEITQYLSTFVPDVAVNTNLGSELTYILPGEDTSKFPEMLKTFEERKDELHISSYGLSITSLEEVFMKVGAEDFNAYGAKPQGSRPVTGMAFHSSTVHPVDGSGLSEMDHIRKVTGVKLLINQIRAMFLKLIYNTWRSKLIALIQFITPIINISLSVLISRSWRFMRSLPPLPLNLEAGFKGTETLLSYGNLTSTDREFHVMEAYKGIFDNDYPGKTLTDIGSENIEEWYLELLTEEKQRARYETLIGATFTPGNLTGWFSNYGYHDIAISLATAEDALLRSRLPNASLTIINQPLPYSIDALLQVMATGTSMGFQFAFNIGFCMAFVAAFTILFVVKERVSGARLVQRVCGAGAGVMWGCALVFDWCWLLLVNLTIVTTLAMYQELTLSTPVELGRILMILCVFSFAIIPVHYLASFYFSSAPSAFAKMCFINIFGGCMPFLITEVLRVPDFGSPYHAVIFDYVFSLLPLYSMSRSIRDTTIFRLQHRSCESLCIQFSSLGNNCTIHTICHELKIGICCLGLKDPFFNWSEPGCGRYMVVMFLVGTIFFGAVLLREYEVLSKIRPKKHYTLPTLPPGEDDDVARERERVMALSRRDIYDYSLVCRDLTKYYKDLVAVRRVTFAVNKAECFGLLGINGAGKTSTFRMLTGDVTVSCGDAFVHGHSVRDNLYTVYKNIGYCPQFDGLLDNLTARETLRIFCLLRGIPASVGKARGIELAHTLGLMKHYDKKVNACSGGTKRKISAAVALLGDAPLIFLDEPTTGMDPASKRLVWRCVMETVQSGRSVILTSHSMEECEALCTRLTVMMDGRLHCLGHPQHLKNKFSQGYTLIVKIRPGADVEAETQSITLHLREIFTDVEVIETYLGVSTYYIKDSGLPWWQIFDTMEKVRTLFSIEDYSVTQTSLEQVFMQFTRKTASTADKDV